MATESPQRAYRAPCPGCGAPVEFRSAQSTHAVCGFCRSTVVRSGDRLARLGKAAELFDDHSPLQLMASGRWEGRSFTLVGRLQFRSASGAWTEWEAMLDDGSSAVLGEDNGGYVWSRELTGLARVPDPAHLRVGATTSVGGKSYTVTANEQAMLVSAEGELPRLPPPGQTFTVVTLRSSDGEVLGIDNASGSLEVSAGREVRLEALQLTGLREHNTKEEQARQFACPNCGAAVQLQLAASKSVSCPACRSIIDVEGGVGGELRHAEQDEPVSPLIPLGRIGRLDAVTWQVVGFQHRMGHEPGDTDEHFGWSEYLLYNRQRGFVFLVDAEDGWSLYKPTTGAPVLGESGQSATYLRTRYPLAYGYEAETVYVAGEFYWPVVRGQKSFVRDFASGKRLLSMEQSPAEVTWSAGRKIASDQVARAFGLDDKKELLKRSDVGPVSAATANGWNPILFLIVAIMVVVLMARSCTSDQIGTPWRTGGGSYGGYSSGGFHK